MPCGWFGLCPAVFSSVRVCARERRSMLVLVSRMLRGGGASPRTLPPSHLLTHATDAMRPQGSRGAITPFQFMPLAAYLLHLNAAVSEPAQVYSLERRILSATKSSLRLGVWNAVETLYELPPEGIVPQRARDVTLGACQASSIWTRMQACSARRV
jgi:hypothetical protein